MRVLAIFDGDLRLFCDRPPLLFGYFGVSKRQFSFKPIFFVAELSIDCRALIPAIDGPAIRCGSRVLAFFDSDSSLFSDRAPLWFHSVGV